MPKKKEAATKKEKSSVIFRTPIVAVMGHVDHGKTSLLDAIRGTSVTESEVGGITQNTRAHQIVTASGNKITFIDTPGHEAFSAMRSRGAKVTDFVLLVVAADDGIQPQTKESIKFAKEANVPIIVAINKIDISGVKLDKVKQELSSYDVQVEEYGGDVMVFPVSATKKTGITELIDGIELLAQVQELKAHAPMEGTLAQGYVLESSLNKQLGAVMLGILKTGKLEIPAWGVTKDQIFKVRAYLDHNQKPIKEVNESDPFWVSGLSGTLATGDVVYFVETEKEAKQLQSKLTSGEVVELEMEAGEPVDENQSENILLQMLLQKEAVKAGVEQKVLNVVVKASSQGTLEAVTNELKKLGDDEKKIHILYTATGEVNESDIKRAKVASGIVISFQLAPSNKISQIARDQKVILRNYEIIYEMFDELSSALDSLIEPADVEVEVARARVKQVFVLTNGETVAGSEVVKGTMLKGYSVYVERPSESTKTEIAEIGRGKITSLKVMKNEVREVKKGQDCGILIDPQAKEIAVGDEIVAFKVEKQV